MKQPFSFEFFPTKTDAGKEKLMGVSQQLAEAGPEFFSVTYGAGGSTKERTLDMVLELKNSGLNVAPHLSFGIDGRDEVKSLLDQYQQAGINRLVCLRGDIPEGVNKTDYPYFASDLIAFIKETTGDQFHIEVACYPEIHPDSQSFESDVKFFKEKVEKGADSAITQYFYNTDSYFYYIDACQKAGIDIPIFPGIMPITNYKNLARFSDACGAEIPRWIRQRLQSYGDDMDSIKDFGLDVVAQISQTLIDGGAPGLHFYTMNQSEICLELLKRIR